MQEYFLKRTLQNLPLYLKIEFVVCHAGIGSYFTGLFFGDRLGNHQLFSLCITLVCLGLLMVSTVDYSGKVSKRFVFLWSVIGLISGIGLSTVYYLLS